MSKHPDVAIVGGGIIGLTCAYFLAKAGLAVEVLDRSDLGREASWAGAGIIPPGNPVCAATPLDRLRAIGSMRFPGFSAELRDLTGIENGYLRSGGVEFLESDDAAVLEAWTAEGIAFERLTPRELRTYEPAVEVVPADPYLLPGCAQVRNPRHLRALIAACEHVGVGLRPHTPIESWIHDRDGNPIGLLPGVGGVVAGRFLITAGAWSETLLGRLGPSPGIHPVRGQIVLLKSPDPVLQRVLMYGKRYLVPRDDGRVLVGSTEEPEARFEKANTADGVAGLLDFALGLVPALAKAEVEKCWSGLRPGSPDGLPFIGPVPGYDSVFVAAGHFRAGIQLSIGTAQVIAELFQGKPTSVPMDAFRLDRAPQAGVRPAFRS
jgi:glycine oxidase